MEKKVKRVILIGFDAAIPEFFLRFRKAMPNVQRLLKKGILNAVLPCIPTDTPTNWTTIATGSWTGTHGIKGFNIHLPGTKMGKSEETFFSDYCQSEYIWEALERQGKRSILINYPCAWSPAVRKKVKRNIIIGGDGLNSKQWLLASHLCYQIPGGANTPDGFYPYWLDVSNEASVIEFHLKSYNDYHRGVHSNKPLLHAWIPVIGGFTQKWSGVGAKLEKLVIKKGLAHEVVARADSENGYNQVLIFDEKGRKLVALKEGEWSDWIKVKVPKDGKLIEGVFKYKLLKLSRDAKTLRIYRTDCVTLTGWSIPDKLAKEVVKNVGPYSESLETKGVGGCILGWYGADVALEMVNEQKNWLCSASKYLSKKHPWDLLFVQIHLQDAFNHIFLSCLEKGFTGFSDLNEKKALEVFRKIYKLTDEMIGKIVKDCADDSTGIVVVSDHGGVSFKKTFLPERELMKAGLVKLKKNKHGDWIYDAKKTKVCCGSLEGIWVNLKGRDPDGIVKPGEEYEKVRRQVASCLMNMKDPETKECPYIWVGPKEEAFVYGLWGDRVEDIVCIPRPDYLPTMYGGDDHFVPYESKEWEEMIRKGFARPALPYATAGHHGLPNSKIGSSSNYGVLLFSGKGVKPQNKIGELNEKKLVQMVDVTPTICSWLGVEAPKNSDGKVLNWMFKKEDKTL